MRDRSQRAYVFLSFESNTCVISNKQIRRGPVGFSKFLPTKLKLRFVETT